MAEQDDRRWEDRFLMVNHNEVVALVLPHQIGNGLHLQIHIAGKQHANNNNYGGDENYEKCIWQRRVAYLKKAMRRLTMSMYCTKR